MDLRKLVLAGCLAIAPLTLFAQSAYLVKDINATTAASPSSSAPQNFFQFGSRVVFVASAPYSAGVKLWITDGTAEGTSILTTASAPAIPGAFAVLNGTLLFNLRDSAHGEELWMSDGTPGGTRLLADMNPGAASSSPGDRIVYHGSMLFAANDGVDGAELWSTDGTPAGTHFFKDLVPGSGSSSPHGFVVLNDTLYFMAGDALWKSDGTPDGTVSVAQTGFATSPVVIGSHMFFAAGNSATGAEPWVSDGTAAGTHMILDIAPGAPSSMFSSPSPAALGDQALFVANDGVHGAELWISDGSAAGTHMVADLAPGTLNGVRSSSIAVVGTNAYFAGSTDGNSASLWKTDGTPSGTLQVRDFGNGGQLASFVAIGDRLFFTGAKNGESSTLWVSDGTSDGTHPVKASDPPTVALGTPLPNINGILYFAGANRFNGSEPWKSDGTDAGTVMIANLAPDQPPSSTPRDLTAAGNYLYFDAWDGSGVPYSGDGPRSLWRSDGTPEGTVKLADGPTFSYPSFQYIPIGQSLFFVKSTELWMTDGTPQGTAPATEFVSRFPDSPSIVSTIGDKILVRTTSGLWATALPAGSPAVSLAATSSSGPFVTLAGKVYFFTQDIGRYALWTTDGTPDGTYPVVPQLPTGIAGGGFGVMGGQIYFATTGSSSSTVDLWKSEGTFDGTVSFATIPGAPSGFATAGRNLFFAVNGQLWVTDGTTTGTHSLNAAIGDPRLLVGVADRAVFVSYTAATASALWVSDGTTDGTHQLVNFGGVAPSNLASVNGRVYFTAWDSVHGSEVYVTDGTVAGTQLASDIEPGSGSSYPANYVAAGNRLFFTATTTATGTELWAMPLPATPLLAVGDVRVREGDSGTTPARFTVTLSPAATGSVTVDWATSDGTATAGTDYDGASGTLTFAPGETSKSIDIMVHGDTTPENNETFFVTLRNAAGATLSNTSATGIIEDDDQLADVALSLDFSKIANRSIGVVATNNGPRAATNVKLRATTTPYQMLMPPCDSCSTEIAPGVSVHAWDPSLLNQQQFFTATASARQTDPNPSNNRVGFTAGATAAMDALFLTQGGQANVWFALGPNDAAATVTSSDPSVIAVPATVAVTPGKPATFAARGVSVGTATLTIASQAAPGNLAGTLTIDVVAPNTVPRVAGGITASPEGSSFRFDRPAMMRIFSNTTAPFSGATATGLVTITANGKAAGTLTLTTAAQQWSVPFDLADIGLNHIVVSYAGDANFLPSTVSMDVTGELGYTSILGDVERNGTNAVVRVQVTGSPRATPTGNVMVQVQGVVQTVTVPLQTRVDGIAIADVPLSNFGPGTQTLFITYSGDPHYAANSQTIRISDVHKRSTRH